MLPSRQLPAWIALLSLTLACDDPPDPAPAAAEPEVAEQVAEDDPVEQVTAADPDDDEPASTGPVEPSTVSFPFESVVRVRYRELLGRVSDEGSGWSPARQRREAAAICRHHLPRERRCPRHVVWSYEDGALEVHRTTEATVRMKYEAGTSERDARHQLRSVIGGSLLSAEGLDVSWVPGWSGRRDALVRQLRQATGDTPVSAGPYECSLAAITRPSDRRETFEENVLARSHTSFVDACVRAAEALCDTPGCHVSLRAFDDLLGKSDQLGPRRVVESDDEGRPADPPPDSASEAPSAAEVRADRDQVPAFEVPLGRRVRRRRTSTASRDGLLWTASGESRRRRSYDCRLEIGSYWSSLPARPRRPIEVTARSPESRVAACHAAVGVARVTETQGSAVIEGSLVVDGLRLPAAQRPWKGSPAVIADRFRAANAAPAGDGPFECTVHAIAWSVASTRSVESQDVPADFTATLPGEPNTELARTAAYCLDEIDGEDATSDHTLVFASDSVVTCAIGEYEARSVRASSPESRGDACAAATERLCDGDCLIEVGAIDGVRVDRSKYFPSLQAVRRGPPRGLILDPF